LTFGHSLGAIVKGDEDASGSSMKDSADALRPPAVPDLGPRGNRRRETFNHDDQSCPQVSVFEQDAALWAWLSQMGATRWSITPASNRGCEACFD